MSVLNDCLLYLDQELSLRYRIIALVHRKTVLVETKNIEFIEFPKSISSYLYRLYYEFIYFNKLSQKIKPYLWLSLHDISPKVVTNIQAVYCHNPSPFYTIDINEFLLDYKFALFNWFYKYLYKINIKSNDYIVVQQEWIKDEFIKIYGVNNIVVASPNSEIFVKDYKEFPNNKKIVFFYPSFPRVFKNFEIICEAVANIDKIYYEKLEVILTIDGTENKYSKMLFEKYSKYDNIKFVGLQSREKVFEIYSQSDCLIFPSKLETWGLPISEFKAFNKPILTVDLPYARETIGNYEKVKFFDLKNSKQLLNYMKNIIDEKLEYDINHFTRKSNLTANSWKELFEILLQDNLK